jgi:protein SCO1/2
VVAAVDPDAGVVVVRHEAVPGYMGAMTMPFRVRPAEEMKGLQPGDTISFRLELTDAESWIGGIERTGTIRPGAETPARLVPPVAEPAAQAEHPLLDFQFTNELGRPVCLRDFRGQALAITFFFTRCPVPDFCPRLSKNFEAASRTLASMPRAPGNWHFLSVSFDPDFDTPAVLKAYAIRYQYDPARWSFLTGPRGEINELARLSGVVVDPEAGLFNHNFRTLIIGPDGQLQTSFPFGGDLSDAIVAAMLKACAASNSIAAGDANRGQEAPRPRIALNQPVPGNNR